MPELSELESREEITGDDCCVAIHTALRKCCESKITTATYNLVFLIGDLKLPARWDPWLAFGKLVARRINANAAAGEQVSAVVCRDAIQYAIGQLEAPFTKLRSIAREKNRVIPEGHHHALYALRYTLQCLRPDDIESMAALLVEEK